jgi:small-conductance mechanosensitive channel
MVQFIESLKISTSPLINVILSLLAVIIIAKAVDLFIDKVLRRFVSFTKTDVDDRIIDIIHRPIYFTIIIIGCTFAVIYMQPPSKVIFYANGTLYTLVAILWTITIIKLANALIEHFIYKVSDATGLSREIVPLAENVFKIAMVVGLFIVILSIWQINITPLLASAGIVGIAIAIAAKDTLANFFGGISVFIDRPYKIGDYVDLDSGERGEVVEIGIRSTRMKTRDDILVTIPNSLIANSKIINESAPIPHFRVRIPIGVSYGSDIDLVEKVLLETAANNSNVQSEPSPRVRFREFGDSALLFELLCWAKEPALRGLTIHQLNSEIYKKFNESGITIPFPQRDVHLYKKDS